MRLNARVGRLEKQLGVVVASAASKEGLTRLLTGKSADEIIAAVDSAISPADHDLVERIEMYMEQAEATPRIANSRGDLLRDEDGEVVYEQHFYLSWLLGLSIGSWSLPHKMPREGLDGFNRRHGCVLWRCESCLLGLGNARHWQACPVCGGVNISQKKLWGPPWDAKWEYSPIAQVTRRMSSFPCQCRMPTAWSQQ